MPSTNTILFVINSNAGPQREVDHVAEIKSFFGDRHRLVFFSLSQGGLNTELRVEIQKYCPKIVVAVGGDGTLRFVADVLRNTGIAMGIIPTGSANGMARELDIPLNIEEALKIVETGKVIDVDLILINNKVVCFHLSDVGLNARLVKYFEKGTVRGKIGYFKALTKILFRRKKMFVSVMAKDKELTREAEMVLIANATKYGTGALINPDGDISDGWFEVLIIRKINLLDVLKMFLKFTRLNSKNFELVQAKKISISSRKKMDFQVDGQYLGKLNDINAEILPGSLKVILPDDNR